VKDARQCLNQYYPGAAGVTDSVSNVTLEGSTDIVGGYGRRTCATQ